MSDNEVIALKVRCYRAERKMTQIELAKLAKLSPCVISYIENEKVPKIRVGTLMKLAEALGVEITDLIG